MFRSTALRAMALGTSAIAAVMTAPVPSAAQTAAAPPYGQAPSHYQAPQPQPMTGKQMFAATLGSLVQAFAPVAVTALAGAITNWPNGKPASNKMRPGDSLQLPGSGGYGSEPSANDGSNPDPVPGNDGGWTEGDWTDYGNGGGGDYPDTGGRDYPDTGGGGDPNAGGGDYPVSGGDPYTVDYSEGEDDCDSNVSSDVVWVAGPSLPCNRRVPPSVYAGAAYEIHAMARDGGAMRVDPATHMFRSGERFVVYYRPTLPGRVDVHNINAAGRHAQIDSIDVAGGELASLGPYEFTAQRGNETLILQLSPCSSAPLMQETYAITRDIVKVADAGPGALRLSACGTATRGVKTRDIRKVNYEDGTNFALDALGPAELSSGEVAPRRVTITLIHR